MSDNERLKNIYFLPFDQNVQIVDESETLLELALKNKIPVPTSCGGAGTCGACRVFIEAGSEQLPPRNEIEKELAEARGYLSHERLACQIPAIEGLIVRVPDKL